MVLFLKILQSNSTVAFCTLTKTSSTVALQKGRFKYSTLYSHISDYYDKLVKMSQNGTSYVQVNADDSIEIMEDGYITSENVNQMNFSFEKPKEITNSLKKNKKLGNENVNDTVEHRTGFAAATCKYPDGKSTSSIILTQVVFQYREGLEKSTTTDYGSNYVCIGIPLAYIEKIVKDAANNSSLNLGVKEKFEMAEGMYWIDCSLEKLTPGSTFTLNERGASTAASLQKMLRVGKHSIEGLILTSLSATITNDSMAERLDLGGRYHITMKPSEVYMLKKSNKKGPQLKNLNQRKKEGANKNDLLVADDDILALALKAMNA